MTTNNLERITLLASEHMNNINASLFGVFGVDSLNEAIKHYQHEAIVDKVLYGCEFELLEAKFHSLNDKRVDSVEFIPFIKMVDKRINGELVSTPTPFICIDKGYGNKDSIDELAYFLDVYEGDDRETIVASYQTRDKNLKTLEEAISARVAHATKKGIAPLDKTVSDATLIYEASKTVCDDILKSMPQLRASWKMALKAVKDDARDMHTAKQAFYGNVCAVLKVAIKMNDLHTASAAMKRRRTQQKSFAKLMKAAQNT